MAQAQVKRKWTFRDLYQSGVRVNPFSRKTIAYSPKVKLVKIIPFAGVKSAIYQLKMNGVTQKTIHNVNIQVSGLKIVTREPRYLDGYTMVDEGDKKYWIPTPSASTSVIKVRCTCKDYYFTFGWWNFRQGSMFGRQQKPYKRKTPKPPKGRPYRNPQKFAGSCKHCSNSVKFLVKNDMWNN